MLTKAGKLEPLCTLGRNVKRTANWKTTKLKTIYPMVYIIYHMYTIYVYIQNN